MADKETNMNEGLPEHRGLDAAGRAAALARLEPRGGIKVGNFADLQRAGADGTFSNDAIQTHPQVNEEALMTPAENDARQGIATVETDRKGTTDKIIKANEKLAEVAQPLLHDQKENKGKIAVTEDPSVEGPEVVATKKKG